MHFVRGFRDGLSPTLPAVCLVLAVCASLVVAAEAAVRANLHLDLPEASFQREDSMNLSPFLAQRVREYRAKEDKGLSIIVFGSSATRQALPDDWEWAERQLEERLGRDVTYMDLSGSAFNPPDLLLYYESLGRGSPGLIIMATSPNTVMLMSNKRMRRVAIRNRHLLACPTPCFEQVMGEHGFDATFPLKLLQLRTVARISMRAKVRELLTHGMLVARKVRLHTYANRPPWAPEDYGRKNYERWFELDPEEVRHCPDLPIEAFEMAHAIAQQRGQKLILIENTAHSSLSPLQVEVERRYAQTLRKFLDEYSVSHYNLQRMGGITDEAFRDFIHMVRQRDRYWEAFVAMVEREIGDVDVAWAKAQGQGRAEQSL